jgi:hypothetical protein
VPLEVVAKVCGDEPRPLTNTNDRNISAFNERVDLAPRDSEETGGRVDREERLHPFDLRRFGCMSEHGRTIPHAVSTNLVLSEELGQTPRRHSKARASRERAVFHVEDEGAVLPTALANDVHFIEFAKWIASACHPNERRRRAEEAARGYVLYKGRRNPDRYELIVALLISAASAPWGELEDKARRQDFFSNKHRKAHWLDPEAREPLDGERVRERWDTLERGAQAVCWLGAFKCIGCGKQFGPTGRWERGAHARRSRRTHCDDCKNTPYASHDIARHFEEMRKAFDAATDKWRLRRARRRAPRLTL